MLLEATLSVKENNTNLATPLNGGLALRVAFRCSIIWREIMTNDRLREVQQMARDAAQMLLDAQREENWVWANRARGMMNDVERALRELEREEA